MSEAQKPDHIEITLEDLSTIDLYTGQIEITEDELIATPTVYPGFTDFNTSTIPITKSKSQRFLSQFTGRALTQALIVAGALGGCAAWFVTELAWGENGSPPGSLLVSMGLWASLICSIIGLALGFQEAYYNAGKEAGKKAALTGGAIGLIGGFIGGVVGQFLYSFLGGGLLETGLALQVVARSLGWAGMGCFAGLGQGFARKSKERLINGLLGGAAGGAVGGLLFDAVGLPFHTGAISRALAISIIGAAVGAGLGIVATIRREAWLRVVKGSMAGKEYILFDEVTRIGSNHKCEIVLYKDALIEPVHAVIQSTGGGYHITNEGNSSIAVNGQPVNTAKLKQSDHIQIGATILEYRERDKRAS
jgi:hypothetical protein